MQETRETVILSDEIETWHVLHPEREVSMQVFGTKAHAAEVKKKFEAEEIEFYNKKYKRLTDRKAKKRENHLASLAKKKK
jgi:hypothetical protein